MHTAARLAVIAILLVGLRPLSPGSALGKRGLGATSAIREKQPLTLAPTSQGFFYCSYVPAHAVLIDQINAETWGGWIKKLSGVEDVVVGGQTTRITTRYSFSLFNGTTRAYDYLVETINAMYAGEPVQIEEDPYTYASYTWKNLILTLPGTQLPEKVVILSAHFDNMPATGFAPGADDNASGAAALLEAARVLKGHSFPHTIRLIWFTGEEQGLIGSRAYTLDHALDSIAGVINLDMFGFDSDNDHCFELHVSTRVESQPVGRCLVDSIDAYGLDLSYDYFTTGATVRSDHANFWINNIGAVEILENYTLPAGNGSCPSRDTTTAYHTSGDTYETINLTTGVAITKAAIAAALSMADPAPLPYAGYFPLVGN